MDASTNWIKSLKGLKKNIDHEWKREWKKQEVEVLEEFIKWIIINNDERWPNPSVCSSDSFSCVLDRGSSVAVVSTKNAVMSIEEWAAIRIQTTFKAFLAKRALRAFKALVRIPALFRGRLVRKKAALTLKCMESLVRAQARVRAQCNHSSQEGKYVSVKQTQIDPTKRAEVGWCSSPGSAEQVKSKLQLRQEAALKRERVAAYALAQPQMTRKPSLYRKTSKTCSLNDQHKSNSEEMHWLEKWMATKKYWKNNYNDEPNMTSSLTFERYRHYYTLVRYSSSSYEQHGTTKVTRNSNNISAKISSSSDPSLDLFHDESTTSNSSSISNSGSNSTLAEGYGYNNKPSYMTATASQKAKQRASPSRSSVNNNMQQRSFDNVSFYYKSSPLSETIHRRSADLYPPVLLDKRNRVRNKLH